MLWNADAVLEVMGNFLNNGILLAELREADEITNQVKRERARVTEMP